MFATSRRASDTCGVTDLPDMRARYEHALAEVAEMKRALAERARHVAELEQRLMRQVEDGARETRRTRRASTPEPTESDLARAVAAAEAEKALAQAEREQLDERERNIRKVERELAGLRVQLEKEWRRAERLRPAAPTAAAGRRPEPAAAAPLPQQPREPARARAPRAAHDQAPVARKRRQSVRRSRWYRRKRARSAAS